MLLNIFDLSRLKINDYCLKNFPLSPDVLNILTNIDKLKQTLISTDN